MNILNRVCAVLFLMGLIVILGLALMQPAASLSALEYGARWLSGVAQSYYYVYVAVGLVGIVLAIALLWLEIRRPQRLTVKVQHAGGSAVELTTDSVSRGLAYHIGQVPGVTSVQPLVVSTGKAVKVTLNLEIDAGVDVPTKTEEVIQLAREVVEGKLGLRLARVAVSVRQAAYTGDVAALPGGRDIVAGLPADGSLALQE